MHFGLTYRTHLSEDRCFFISNFGGKNMFKKKLEALQEEIKKVQAQINTQVTEAKAHLESDNLEAAHELKASIDANKKKLADLKKDKALYEEVVKPQNKGGSNFIGVEDEEQSYREALNVFLHSKGTIQDNLEFNGKSEVKVPVNEINPALDGIKKEDTKSVTSDDVSYVPRDEVNHMTDLKELVTVHKTTKGKGSYPILKKTQARMNSVAELEKNPKLAKPEFIDVDWEVETYRGAIPLSEESIEDADVDLIPIVGKHIERMKINTRNYKIATVAKTFAKKEVTNLDGLKTILNVDLDPDYQVEILSSQTLYNWLDTLKDENGRYLLQDSIVSPSGKVFNGKPIHVVSDDIIGKDSGWIGDMKQAFLFVDRKDIGLRWLEHDIYGQYLQAVVRMDTKTADKSAGYYLTVKPAATE